MKKFAAIALVASLASTAAFAGGPVVVVEEDTPVVVTERTSSTGGVLVPVLIGAPVLCAVACGSDS